ncbi:MAG: DNA topoisomerase IV subunit A [Proteobacteria bacterium]|nr:DNA topoisomerase IV subunit A [Pseudomonadota bacterium]
MTRLEPLMERNFLEYASYVIVDRAIPDIRDGLKPVQRRILATLFGIDDGKFHKVANVIGDTMKLHPHGDASIGDALVTLANKDFFIEKQGNFGNIITGHASAAPRYIECRLTDLARETMFSKALLTYQPSYDGRNEEPVFLPAKLPVTLMLGIEGIAVGMSTKILPHNFTELLEAQIQILRHKPFRIDPDFPTGGLIDVSEYNEGRGKVRVRARIEKVDDKTIAVREIPYTTTTESLIASIENAAQKGKVKIGSIDDFTTDHVEIEIGLPRGTYADDVIPQLYAYTDCEVSISSNILIIKDRHPIEMSTEEALRFLTDQLRDQICGELEFELEELKRKRHWLTLERIFIEGGIYKRIEKATTNEQVKLEVYDGLKPFFELLDRTVVDDDIRRLLEIPIRRISQYDIEKNFREIEDTDLAIKKTESKLKRLTQETIKYLTDLLKKFGKRYPRRSKITTFETVDVRAVARQNIKVSYDTENGFFGSEVKGSNYQFTVSEYDRFLIVCKDGSFRIIGPEAKTLIPGKVLYLNIFDQENGKSFTVIYRNKDKIAYAKKIQIRRFIRDREYELIKDKEGKIDLLLKDDIEGTVQLDFIPTKRQRIKQAFFNLDDLSPIGVSARGSRMASKPVSKMKLIRQNNKETVDKETPKQEIPEPPAPKATKKSKVKLEPKLLPKAKPKTKRGKKKKPPNDDGEQFSLF